MSISKFLRTATAAALAATAAAGAFADTANMTVSASVPVACRLTTVPSLSFGTLDQVAAPAVNPAAVNVQYKCTSGTAPTSFSVGGDTDGSFAGSLGNGTDTIAYTITWANPTAAGDGLGPTGTAISVPLTGSMAGGANYQAKSTGTYTQTVQIAINP